MASASRSSPLIVLHTEGTRRTVSVDHLPFTLGRGHDCHLTIGHPHVSREHAAIDRDADGYILRDTASRHGTFVNGVRVSTTRLRPGDRIALFPDADERDTLIFEQPEEESSTRTLLAQITKSQTPGQGGGLIKPGTDHTQVVLAMGGQSELETLALFLKAAQSLNSYGAINDVLRSMLEYTLRLTGAERGFVFLGDTPDTLRLECWQDKDGNATTASVPLAPVGGERSDRPAISYSIVRDAAESHLDFILSNISPDAARGHDSLILNAIRSVVAIPLRGQNSDRLLGVLYLDSRSIAHDFTRTGKQILQAIARQAATLLENLRMIEAERESALLRKELEIAAAIQQQIIPQTLPAFPGVRLAARSVPCTGVGGDFYDVIPVEDGFVALIGDVCGKGVPAALLASMVQGMLHAQISAQSTSVTSLAQTVQAVTNFVCLRAPAEKYVTLAILRYTFPLLPGDPAQIELINGGHVCPMIVRANNTVETICEGDMPVGLLDTARFHAILINLYAGDRIILLSDGISEAEDPDGTQFGTTEMTRHLASIDPVPSLFRAMHNFCKGAHAQDDQTVLTVDRLA